jgi:hypothetical protein
VGLCLTTCWVAACPIPLPAYPPPAAPKPTAPARVYANIAPPPPPPQHPHTPTHTHTHFTRLPRPLYRPPGTCRAGAAAGPRQRGRAGGHRRRRHHARGAAGRLALLLPAPARLRFLPPGPARAAGGHPGGTALGRLLHIAAAYPFPRFQKPAAPSGGCVPLLVCPRAPDVFLPEDEQACVRALTHPPTHPPTHPHAGPAGAARLGGGAAPAAGASPLWLGQRAGRQHGAVERAHRRARCGQGAAAGAGRGVGCAAAAAAAAAALPCTAAAASGGPASRRLPARSP